MRYASFWRNPKSNWEIQGVLRLAALKLLKPEPVAPPYLLELQYCKPDPTVFHSFYSYKNDGMTHIDFREMAGKVSEIDIWSELD